MNEEEKAYFREYHKKHIGKIRAFRKVYYQKHKEEIKARVKKWTIENKEWVRERAREYNKKHSAKLKKHSKEYHDKIVNKFLTEYKIGKCCEICGYNEYPEILQFHHKNPKEKSFNISQIMGKWDLIEKEIKKCVLICPNCHFWLHYQEGSKV